MAQEIFEHDNNKKNLGRVISMLTIDAQVHAYEKNHSGRPWIGSLAGPEQCTGDDMVNAMDSVGVDGALLVSPYSMYRYDASYAIEVYAAHPGRFGLIKPIDPSDPAVKDIISDWASIEGSVAIRIMMAHGGAIDPNDAGIKQAMDAASDHGLPINLLCWGKLDQATQLAAENPNTMLVIDHLGLKQPFSPPPPSEPFKGLDQVIKLSEFDNITIKITGACTLSREPYPYNDLWDPLYQIFNAYGIRRCMWGTDWTRAVDLLSYAQGVEPFRLTTRLSEDERADFMGKNLERIYKWSPSDG